MAGPETLSPPEELLAPEHDRQNIAELMKLGGIALQALDADEQFADHLPELAEQAAIFKAAEDGTLRAEDEGRTYYVPAAHEEALVENDKRDASAEQIAAAYDEAMAEHHERTIAEAYDAALAEDQARAEAKEQEQLLTAAQTAEEEATVNGLPSQEAVATATADPITEANTLLKAAGYSASIPEGSKVHKDLASNSVIIETGDQVTVLTNLTGVAKATNYHVSQDAQKNKIVTMTDQTGTRKFTVSNIKDRYEQIARGQRELPEAVANALGISREVVPV